jgi:hypothetical protein
MPGQKSIYETFLSGTLPSIYTVTLKYILIVLPDIIVERPHGVKLSQLFVSLSSVYVAVLNDSVLMLGIIIVPLENERFLFGT